MARYERMSVRTYVSLAALNAGQAVIFTLGLIVVLVMCVAEVRNGTKTVGAFVLVNLIMLQLYQPLNFMGMVYRDIKQAIIDVEAMFAILAQNPEIEDLPGAQPLKVSAGAVRFENVEFAYDPGRPILRGVSFDAPAGHTIAIVGPSGAGKSTISRLLFRFYEPSAGRILIDGQDIGAVTQSSLRARDRHGAAGHGAVQRYAPLQHPLRARRRQRAGRRRGGRERADRLVHPLAAAWL